MTLTQQPLGDPIFADNPEPRCPVVLVLDTSYSMDGRPIDELNAGLQTFRDELFQDALATKRVEVAIVTFGPVATATDFVGAETFIAPTLRTTGDTPMGSAIETAIDMLDARKASYRNNGIDYYRPWIFLITDGAPTDDWSHAAQRVKQGEIDKAFAFFAIGVEGADMSALTQISSRQPLELNQLRFRELFAWLSTSLKKVSSSRPTDENITLAPPTGWASI